MGTEKQTLEELLKKHSASLKRLNSREAQKRLEFYGPNEITEKKKNPLLMFLGYFWGPIPWIIEIAAALSGVNHEWNDFAIISGLLVLNGVIGFWQENQADNAIESLRKKLLQRQGCSGTGNG